MNSYSWALQSTVYNTLSYISKSSEISILEDTDVPLVHTKLSEAKLLESELNNTF